MEVSAVSDRVGVIDIKGEVTPASEHVLRDAYATAAPPQPGRSCSTSPHWST